MTKSNLIVVEDFLGVFGKNYTCAIHTFQFVQKGFAQGIGEGCEARVPKDT